MAPRSSGRANASNVKRKPHRTFPPDAAKGNEGLSKGRGSDRPSDDKPEFIESHQQFPCSFSLNNLIRLDWSRRQEFFPHGPGATRYEQFGFSGRTYAVQSLNPETSGNPFVILLPEARYYVVPIYEESQSADAPARLLLIQSRTIIDEPRPHIAVIEPHELLAPEDHFAHLHIIGGEDDSLIAEPELHSAGMVEAVLTVIESPSAQTEPDSPPISPQSISPQPPLTSDDAAKLCQLLEQFSLEQLKDLAFDIGVGDTRLHAESAAQFSRDLVRYLEARGELACLVNEASKRRNDEFLKQLIIKLPPCAPRTKVQIVLEPDTHYDLDRILSEIVVLTKIKAEDIELLGTATGSLRILISISQTAAEILIKIKIDGLVFDGNQVVSISIFASLDGFSQAAWRVVARKPHAPPTSWNNMFTLLSGEPDPDLLDCIDYFHEIMATHAGCAPALGQVQAKFYDYLRRKFDYRVVPIEAGTTLFSQWLGHVRDDSTVLRLAGVGDGIIVRVNRDGYRRGIEVKRPATVVVNQPPTTTLRHVKRVRLDQFYVELEAPKALVIDRLLEEAGSHFKLINAIYSVFALTLSSQANLSLLAADLQQYSRSSSQLPQLANALEMRLHAAQLAPLRFRLGSRNARQDAAAELPFSFVVLGDAVPLDATREVILKQAANQGANKYFVLPNIGWLMTRVRRLRQLDDQTCEALARGIAWLLSQFALATGLRMEQAVTAIEFERSGMSRGEDLTLDFMTMTIRPYLAALESLQRVIDRIHRQSPHTLTLTEMEANPIRISFSGGFDAVPIARDTITPWKKAHLKDLLRVANKPAKIELLETGARTILRRARLKAMRAGLEIRREKLEIEKANLAREILKDLGLNLRNMTDEQIDKRVQALLPAITTIVNSELMLAAT